MQVAFVKCHGSGNDFPLIDARAMALAESDWATLARLLADRDGPVGGDGLLALFPGDAEHGFAMRMWNSDGTEAETCLNGLRCVSRLGFEALGIDAARVRLKTSSVEVARAPAIAPGVTTIRTRAAPASTRAADIPLAAGLDAAVDVVIPGVPSSRSFTAVAIPNPHLIAFVDRIDEDELVALGHWAESAPPELPRRANISFVELRGEAIYVRTFERGVGLTDSCGSAMAASTYAAGLSGRQPFGQFLTVFNKGGRVRAMAEAPADGARVTIEGNATFLYDATIEVDLAAGTAASPLIHARREDEVRAWEAALAA